MHMRKNRVLTSECLAILLHVLCNSNAISTYNHNKFYKKNKYKLTYYIININLIFTEKLYLQSPIFFKQRKQRCKSWFHINNKT